MPSVLFDMLLSASGHQFGVATLDTPTTINALSLEMIDALTPQLRAWAHDDAIAGVILQGSGPKGFCAGGDVRALYQAIRESDGGPAPYVQQFFEREYRLDYLIHTYPKPVLCWGHGVVFGGGIGLLAGASHRVVTPNARLAMPEISLGLYPDVGGDWFLARMPGKTGLFLSLTGAMLNASDARFAGLADYLIDHEEKDLIFDRIQRSAWTGNADTDRLALSQLLADFDAKTDPVISNVRSCLDEINTLIGDDTLADIDARMRSAGSTNEWLATAMATYRAGSPTSAAVIYELSARSKDLSLAEVFRLEYTVSLGFCAHPDFTEGVRALLIDKDKRPRWTPATLDAVTPQWVAEHFVPRYKGAHPLADLG